MVNPTPGGRTGFARSSSNDHQAHDWTIAYVDTRGAGRGGWLGGQIESRRPGKREFWHTEWKNNSPALPHRDREYGQSETSAVRLRAAAGCDGGGRIKDYRIYIGDALVQK